MEYGLIGEKLTYSFSKIIHEQIANYNYVLHPLSKYEFENFMKTANFKAINVTIPYKESVIPYIHKLDDNAKKIGAVNTIVNRNGKLYGYNTDFLGFIYQIKHNKIEIKNKKVIVLGNGGASKSVVEALKFLKADEICIVYYKQNKNTISYKQCYDKHNDADIIINTTPVGMFSNENKSPININKFYKLNAVIDIIYNPLKTKLILQAEDMNIKAINGIDMLVAQAKYSIEYFLGKKFDDNIIDTIVKKIKFEKSNIVFIGMPSVGKTTIGKICSKELNKEFIDTDEEIVKKTGIPISEYFKIYGEKKFREVEKNVCAKYSIKNNCVISTGGGAIKNNINMEKLKSNGIIVFIDCDIKNLSIDETRPLLKDITSLEKLYKQRISLYKKYADITVYNDNNFEKCKNDILYEIKKYFSYFTKN